MLDWQQLTAAYYLPLALACGWWRWRGACAPRATQPASLYLSLSRSLSRISLICLCETRRSLCYLLFIRV